MKCPVVAAISRAMAVLVLGLVLMVLRVCVFVGEALWDTLVVVKKRVSKWLLRQSLLFGRYLKTRGSTLGVCVFIAVCVEMDKWRGLIVAGSQKPS